MLEGMIAVGKLLLKERAGLTENQQQTQGLLGFHLPPVAGVPFLHLHVVGPRRGMSLLGAFLFWDKAPWFASADPLLMRLKGKQRAQITI
ncbi:unnamed protein product [Phaeothamnion confervicola]